MNEESSNQTPKGDPGKSPSPAPASMSGAGGGGGITKLISGIASALGLDRGRKEEPGDQTGDVTTRLAHQRTDLAINRNYMAADRTLMAWIRTSLSMISFGFTIGKLGQIMGSVEVKGIFHTKMISVESISYFLVILGTVALFGASLQHFHRMRELYAMGLPRQRSITFIVALLLVAVGGFALSSLVLAL
jgi:putative membrane protein